MNEFNVIETPLAGTNLIEASAGTGKTYAISIIYLRLIAELDLKIEEILAVTFTIPATMELRARIRERLADALNFLDGGGINDRTVEELMKRYSAVGNLRLRISAALRNFDQASVFTIHSFCQQLLADNAFESGNLFSSEIVKNDELIEQGAADLLRRVLYFAEESVAEYILAGCELAELVKLYRVRPLSGDLKIRPDIIPVDTKEIDSHYRNVKGLYGRLSELWKGVSDDVKNLFTSSNMLKSSKQRDLAIEKIIEKMDLYIDGGDPFNIFTDLYRYTSGEIEKLKHNGITAAAREVFDICQSLTDSYAAYNRLGGALLAGVKRRLFEEVDALLLKKRSVSGRKSFDDLIRDAHRGLTGGTGGMLAARVSARYRAALIDEFQDTDTLQFEIFDRLFNNSRTLLFLIGDPKQAIYRFRGADLFSYIRASRSVKNCYTLARNWRSRSELISAVNCMFERCSSPFIFEQVRFHTVSAGDVSQGERLFRDGEPLPPLGIWLAPEDETGSGGGYDRLASEISQLISTAPGSGHTLDGRAVTPKDIAVLVRTKRNGEKARVALARYNIPSVSRGMGSVFDSEEAMAIYFIVHAVSDPSNSRALKTALSTSVIGWSSTMLFEGDGAGSDRLNQTTTRFYHYRDLWLSGGFTQMLSALIDGESVAARLLSLENGDRMITNINHLMEIIQREEQRSGRKPKETVSWFAGEMISRRDSDEYTMRPERDDEAVTIITMHACKGLEFPVVYSLDLDYIRNYTEKYTIYHDSTDGNRPVLYLGKDAPDDVKRARESEDLAESVRLLYVAVTRAKSACRIMLSPNNRFLSTSAGHIFIKSPGYQMQKYNRGGLVSALAELAGASAGTISFIDGGVLKGRRYQPEVYNPELISARTFSGRIGEVWRTHSYSSIASRGIEHDPVDSRDFVAEYTPVAATGSGIFGFPAGARAGSCIHEVFEKLSFQSSAADVERVCGEALQRYRFDPSLGTAIAEMFSNVVNTPFDNAGLKLSGVTNGARLSELEFSFTVDRIDTGRLSDIFSGTGDCCDSIPGSLPAGVIEPGGFMKGFIDLVFEYRGRYYIADWKSNHLGNSYHDYSRVKIASEMSRHNYYLQYYIYTVALHRYLKLKVDGYDYDRDFGGVFYLFVRGITPENGGATGIFRDVPDRAVVEKLDAYFGGGAG